MKQAFFKVVKTKIEDFKEVTYTSEPIKGVHIKIAGYDCYIFKEGGENYWPEFIVTEGSTGMKICADFKRKHAIAKALKKLSISGVSVIIDEAKQKLKKQGIICPVNEPKI